MALYLIHYCYYQLPSEKHKESSTLQRHDRLVIDLPHDLEYSSDVEWVERHLAGEHMKAGNLGCSDFRLLNWQRMTGHARPAEGI